MMTFTQPSTPSSTPALSPTLKINFQPDRAPIPDGYQKDKGDAYGTHGFGWVREDSLSAATPTPLDIHSKARDRKRSGIDPRLNTLLHMQSPPHGFRDPVENIPAAWQCDLPNGSYNVSVSVGDRAPYDSQHTIRVQGIPIIVRFQGSPLQEYQTATARIDVTNGKLTVDAIGGTNTKINYIEISPVDPNPPSGATLELENLDRVPFADRLVFNRIGRLTNPPANRVHDRATLRVKNTSNTALTITELNIQGPWEIEPDIEPPISLPVTIETAKHLDLLVRFQATGGAIHRGTLTIVSNAINAPNQVVQLAGFWQRVSEGGQEPELGEIVQVFGYQTTITKAGQTLNRQGKIEAVGDEVLSPFWQVADPAKPVIVRQLAAYHTQGNTATIAWHHKGNNTTTKLFTHDGMDGQSLLPYKNNSTTKPAEGQFTPNGTFGFKVDNEWSDPQKNRRGNDEGHHVRFWPVKDRTGQVIAHTWIMAMDYSGINYDYNDNVYLITNMKPAI